MFAGLLLAILLFGGGLASAFGILDIRVQSHIEALSGSGWQARGIEFEFQHGAGTAEVMHVFIERLALPEPLQAIDGIDLQCPEFVLSAEWIGCEAGELRIGEPGRSTITGRVAFDYRPSAHTLSFTAADLTIGGGQTTLQGTMTGSDWTLQLDGTKLDAVAVHALLASTLAWSADQGTVQGGLDVHASLAGKGSMLAEARFRVVARGLGFSADAGRFAVEGLGLDVNGNWQFGGGENSFAADLESSGQVYLNPVFLELPAGQPLRVRVTGRSQNERLAIDSLQFTQPGVLRAEGAFVLLPGKREGLLQRADIRIMEAVFPAVYSAYVQPFLADTVLGELQLGGSLQGRVAYARGALQSVWLDLADLRLEDTQNRFGIAGFNGLLQWEAGPEPQPSRVRWRHGHVYRLQIGTGDLHLESRGDSFQLVGQERIPLFDGAVVINRLQGRGLGSADVQWQFDGLVSPISMEAMSIALDWPRLAGKVSGVIPDVRYANHELRVGGTLRIRIFEGEITVTGLRIENPLGISPTVFANLDMRNLDLAALTRTFDFGKIEGKLDGRVRDLRLDNWEPTRFDAVFLSPKEERSPRRISQRAVENISALSGGGVTEALSRGVIGLFNEFRYRRLGISCRLRNGICEMDGVAPADEGYYLVEGGGLPRIDVIGYTRRVDWHELLARLKAAARSDRPVVR